MTRSINFSEGEFYHIYNRGTEKRKVFLSTRDYDRFVILLYLCNSNNPVHISAQGKSIDDLFNVEISGELVSVGAYCLMPNHFHLLLKEKSENGISRFMQKLTTGYTMYFNKRNDRTGTLFQGVFKAEHADKDEYLKYLFAYIHLNPIKLINQTWKENGIKNKTHAEKFLESYKYSSYLEYSSKVNRKEKVILDIKEFPEYFEGTNDFHKMIKFWIDFKNSTNNL